MVLLSPEKCGPKELHALYARGADIHVVDVVSAVVVALAVTCAVATFAMLLVAAQYCSKDKAHCTMQ